MSSLTFPGRRSRRAGRGNSTDVQAPGSSAASGVTRARSAALPRGSGRGPGA